MYWRQSGRQFFLAYISNSKEATPLYCGLLAVLATFIINIVLFIFSELRCLRIAADVDDKIKDIADEKFLSIWDTFGLSLFTAMLLVLINILFSNMITKESIVVVILLGGIADGISSLFPKRVSLIIKNIATPMLLYAFFSVPNFFPTM